MCNIIRIKGVVNGYGSRFKTDEGVATCQHPKIKELEFGNEQEISIYKKKSLNKGKNRLIRHLTIHSHHPYVTNCRENSTYAHFYSKD